MVLSAPTHRILTACALLTAACVVPAFAASGYVEDPDGKPIEGARVCYLVPGEAEVLCVHTDQQGYYVLPESRMTTVRIIATGYLPRKVAAAPQDKPIRLERAASLLVRLRDATTGQPISGGEVVIVRPSGRKAGPLYPNAAGLRFRTLPPGRVRLTAKAEGYEEIKGHAVQLVGGRESEVVLKLKPSPESGPSE